MMTWSANQECGRPEAKSFTAVGLRRVSIGPPIMIIALGTAGSFSAAMSDTAASTGTVGWQTDITFSSGDRKRMNSRM